MRTVGYQWNLRQLMATRGLFTTTDLVPLLAERGIDLHFSQVYRLVTGTPERLNLHILAALCDILDCTAAELIPTHAHAGTTRPHRRAKAAGEHPRGDDADRTRPGSPTRARIVRDEP
jgi:DNA-binding Xre family transcriptional regulator